MECKLFKTGGGKLRERELIDTLWNVNQFMLAHRHLQKKN